MLFVLARFGCWPALVLLVRKFLKPEELWMRLYYLVKLLW